MGLGGFRRREGWLWASWLLKAGLADLHVLLIVGSWGRKISAAAGLKIFRGVIIDPQLDTGCSRFFVGGLGFKIDPQKTLLWGAKEVGLLCWSEGGNSLTSCHQRQLWSPRPHGDEGTATKRCRPTLTRKTETMLLFFVSLLLSLALFLTREELLTIMRSLVSPGLAIYSLQVKVDA